MRYSEDFKNAVREAYRSGDLTVDQIALKYGIGRRTVYMWLKHRTGRRCLGFSRLELRLTKEEAEAVLLALMDSKMSDDRAVLAKSVENRLIEKIEELDEIERSRG